MEREDLLDHAIQNCGDPNAPPVERVSSAILVVHGTPFAIQLNGRGGYLVHVIKGAQSLAPEEISGLEGLGIGTDPFRLADALVEIYEKRKR